MAYYYQSPMGTLCLKASSLGLTSLSLVSPTIMQEEGNDIEHEAARQLNYYFNGELQQFNLPFDLKGTDFQLRVWQQLCTIPYGKTISYASLAQQVGSARAYRAVGSANGANPLAIIIPCHRVINSNGQWGGYAYGLKMKKELVLHEKQFVTV